MKDTPKDIFGPVARVEFTGDDFLFGARKLSETASIEVSENGYCSPGMKMRTYQLRARSLR
jgi:hypothetical protein